MLPDTWMNTNKDKLREKERREGVILMKGL